MLKLKYAHRHTFLISLGIALIIFGLYKFYITEDLAGISLKMWMFHVPSFLLGDFFFLRGIRLWSKRDKNEEEIVKYQKQEMEIGVKLGMLAMKEKEFDIDSKIETRKIVEETKFAKAELEKIKKQKEEHTEKIEEINKEEKKLEDNYRKQIEKLEQLEDKIAKKRKEIFEEKEEIFSGRITAINNLPLTVSIEPTQAIFSSQINSPFLGNMGMGIQGVNLESPYAYAPASSLISSTSPSSPSILSDKICSICGKTYKDFLSPGYVNTINICEECRDKGTTGLYATPSLKL